MLNYFITILVLIITGGCSTVLPDDGISEVSRPLSENRIIRKNHYLANYCTYCALVPLGVTYYHQVAPTAPRCSPW